MPHIKSGRLRGMAVTTLRPTALVPGVPSVAESALPVYESIQSSGLFVPARTSPAIVDRLYRETVQTLNRPDIEERYFNIGAEVVANTPQEFAAKIKSEMARMGKVIKDAGIKLE